MLVIYSTFTLFSVVCFFFNDTSTTEIYTLSLHDALPISCWESSIILRMSQTQRAQRGEQSAALNTSDGLAAPAWMAARTSRDRKSTRLNSSHVSISYAVFCLKKKKNKIENIITKLCNHDN